MTNISKPILFFGTDEFSTAALHALIEAKYQVAAVITKPDSRSGRGQHLTPPLVKTIAEQHNIPVWQPAALSDVTDNIRALGEVTGVLSSYGRIIPQAIIDLFTRGIINIHPSLLPKYRGPSPIEATIVNGDPETGVSIMQLSADMDAGPVYAQKTVPLTGTETQPELAQKLADIGSALLLDVLPGILDGSLLPTPQTGEPTYCSLLKKEDGLLNPETMTAAEAERRVRAFLSFPKTKATILGQTVTITKAHVSSEPNDGGVRFKDGAFLVVDELIGPSGRRMGGQDFLNGYAAA